MWPKMERRRAAGAAYARETRRIGHGSVSDEVVPSNAIGYAALWHVMWNACSLRESSFNSVQVLAPQRLTVRTHVYSVDSQLGGETQSILAPDSV